MAGPKAFGPRQSLIAKTESNPAEGGGGSGSLSVDSFDSLFVRIAGKEMDGNGYWNAGMLDGLDDGIDMQNFDGSDNFLAVQAMLGILRNGTTDILDRLRGFPNAIDGQATTATVGSMLGTFALPALFNGATFDRARSLSAANLATLRGLGGLIAAPPGNWSVTHTPAAATQATITRAAGGAGIRHVCTSIDAALVLPAGVNQPYITLNLRDGATGVGTILWSRRFGIGAVNAADAQQEVSLSNLNIVGTGNVAMTLEFSAAGVALTAQSVAMTGYDAA